MKHDGNTEPSEIQLESKNAHKESKQGKRTEPSARSPDSCGGCG